MIQETITVTIGKLMTDLTRLNKSREKTKCKGVICIDMGQVDKY